MPTAIVNARWSWRPPPRLDAMDAAFDMRIQWISMSTYIVDSLTILVIFGVRKYERTLYMLMVDSAMTFHSPVLVAFLDPSHSYNQSSLFNK